MLGCGMCTGDFLGADRATEVETNLKQDGRLACWLLKPVRTGLEVLRPLLMGIRRILLIELNVLARCSKIWVVLATYPR